MYAVLLAASAVLSLLAAAPAQARSGLGPATGVLFIGDYQTSRHYCSAVVVRSTSRNLVATAAHCLAGDGSGLEFVPGYDHGHAPYGSWQVHAVYVDSAWRISHDPHHDFAFLSVVAHNGTRLQSRVNSFPLGTAPPRRARATMYGYLAGSDDGELHCTGPSYRTNAHPLYPAINCRGFGGGTSGGAWRSVATGRLVGVTGGLHQGGCSPDTSFTAPFGAATAALFRRAQRGGTGDVVVPAGPDGC